MKCPKYVRESRENAKFYEQCSATFQQRDSLTLTYSPEGVVLGRSFRMVRDCSRYATGLVITFDSRIEGELS